MFFYLVANFMHYKISKNSSVSYKNSLIYFRSKIMVCELVCDEPEEICEYWLKLESNSCSVQSVTNQFDSWATLAPDCLGQKSSKQKNQNSKFIVSPQVLLCSKSPYIHGVYTLPCLPCRKHKSIRPILTSQRSMFKLSHFSHASLWNELATGHCRPPRV
jgi:hypothetical protein